ncbi:MAG: hypothetical protein JWS12_421 [Candidatus Saccharibacteria bacterium]|nr:hypothetical protein [Candidatus Saccharibacteria bacterium]
MFGHDSHDDTDENQTTSQVAPAQPDLTEPTAPAPAMQDDSYDPPTSTGAPVISPTSHDQDEPADEVGVSVPPATTLPAVDDHTGSSEDILNHTDTDDLLNIKQQALQQLSPLVDHLDQSPEEKFRTTMMMIQASDNQDLIKVAYQAAGEIKDEKARAQALLDIVNEINYFTQQAQN